MADVELEVAEEARVAQNRAGALLQNGVGPAGLHQEQERVDPERLRVIESHTRQKVDTYSGYKIAFNDGQESYNSIFHVMPILGYSRTNGSGGKPVTGSGTGWECAATQAPVPQS